MRYTFLVILLILVATGSAQEYYQAGKKVQLTPLVSSQRSSQITAAQAPQSPAKDKVTWYTNPQGKRVGVMQEILVTWNEGAPREEILAGYPIVKQKDLTDKITLISLTSGADVFLIAQQLYERAEVKSAHPNMIQERERR